MKTGDWLKSSRLRLRAIEPEDLSVLYTLENDTSLWDISSATVPYSKYVLKQFVAQNKQDIFLDGQLRLMAEDVTTGDVVGVSDLVEFDPRNLRAEIGIIVRKLYRRQGYATEILQILENYAVGFLHLHQVYAYVSADNAASIHLFEGAGYVHTATMPEWLQRADHFQDVRLYQKLFPKNSSESLLEKK